MCLEGDPVIITVGLWVLSIDSINVVDMVRRFLYFCHLQPDFLLTDSRTLWVSSDNFGTCPLSEFLPVY